MPQPEPMATTFWTTVSMSNYFFFLRKSQVILCNICLPLFGLFYLPCRFSCSIQGMAESPGENGWVGQRTGSIWNPIPCSVLMTRKSYLGNQFLLWKWWSWVLHDGGGDEISIQTSFSFYFAELVFLPSSTKAGLKHLQCLKSHCHIYQKFPDWRQEEKGMTEDEMVGWHHQLKGHEFEQAPGVGDGQGSLACCSP